MPCKIYNYSKFSIDRKMWQEIAVLLGLDGPVENKTLRAIFGDIKNKVVVVHKQKPHQVRCGEFDGVRRLDIWPCADCSEAWLLCVYLHELLHLWISEKHPSRGNPDPITECLAWKLSHYIFRAMNGKITNLQVCKKYGVKKGREIALTTKARRILSGLNDLKPSEITDLVCKDGWKRL